MVDFRKDRDIMTRGAGFTCPETSPVNENREHSNSVDALTANPVNRSLYCSGSHDFTIKVWDANHHNCVSTLTGHEQGLWSLNYLADGKRLISSSVDGTARLWDVASARCTQTLTGHASRVYTAVVNEDMTLAATVGADKKVCLWDLRNASQPVFVNADSPESVTCCDFSTDQKSLITATFGGRINVIDLETKEMRVDYDTLLLSPEVEENLCYHLGSVKNHPAGGNVFVLSSGVGVPNVISYEGWHNEPLHRLATIGKYHGHSSAVRRCEFSPDRSKLLSCCADGSVVVWGTESQQAERVLAGHSDLVTSGAWLSESVLVTGSWDCKILLWNL